MLFFSSHFSYYETVIALQEYEQEHNIVLLTLTKPKWDNVVEHPQEALNTESPSRRQQQLGGRVVIQDMFSPSTAGDQGTPALIWAAAGLFIIVTPSDS